MDSMRRVHNQTTVCRFDLQHYSRCCCCLLLFVIGFSDSFLVCMHAVFQKYRPLQQTTIVISCRHFWFRFSVYNKNISQRNDVLHAIRVFLVSCWCVLSINSLSECFDFLFMFLWPCYNIFNSSLSLWNFGWRWRRENHMNIRMIPNAQWNTFTIIAIEAFLLLVFGDDVRLIWWWLGWFTVVMHCKRAI